MNFSLSYFHPMKTARFFLQLSALPLLTISALAGGFVYPTTGGFSATGDFDGNGQEDVILVDEATGLYRIGSTAVGGAVTFAEPRPSGMPEISGVAVGRMNGIASTSLAVTSPLQNRWHLLTPSTPGYTEPRVHTIGTGVGTTLLGALDIPGIVPAAEDDLALVSVLNGANLVELKQFRMTAGSATLLDNGDVPDGAVRQGNPFAPAAGSAQLFGYLQASGATDSFRAWQLTGVNPNASFVAAALPAGSSWIAASLEGANTDLVFYKTGTASGSLRRIQPNGVGWLLAATVPFTLPVEVEEIVPVNTPGGGRLLVRLADGSLTFYGYSAAGGFSAGVPLPVSAPAGVLAGMLPMSGNAFRLLYAPAAGQSPTAMVPFSNSGTGWVQGPTIALPALNSFDIYANLFILSGPLFRTANPDLLRTYRSSDWSTGITVPASAPYTVTGQTADFVSATQGIGTSAPVNVGALSSSAPASAANQLNSQFSLFTFESTLGSLPDTVTISPAPGSYDHAVQLTFSGIGVGSVVYYRTSSTAAFQAWVPTTPPWLTANATVEYYVIFATNSAPVQRALYTFTLPPARQDQDGDGVPDFVEIAKGLSPSGGSDSDGDGFSDLSELHAGTNPNLSTSKPSAQPSPTASPLVDIIPQPRLVGGAADGTVAVGTLVNAYDPAHGLLGTGTVAAGGAARVALRDLSPETGFAVVRTEPHFVVTPLISGAPLRGKEMLAVIPALPQESWSYGTTNGGTTINETWSWGGANFSEGSPDFPTQNAAESTAPQIISSTWSSLQDDPAWGASPTGTRSADSWITQYQAASSTTARPYLSVSITPESTLRALLLEEVSFTVFSPILGGDLLQRFSLTADRARDLGDRTHSRGDAALLRQGNPASFSTIRYRMLNVLRHLDALAIATKTRAERTAREIYAATPGNTTDAPLDALRQYVRTGVIPTAYRSAVSATDPQLATTWNQLQTLRNTAPVRPLQTLTLRRTAANGTGPWLLTNPADNSQLALITEIGFPYLDAFFNLPEVDDEVLVTGYTDTPTVGGYPSIEVLSCKWELSEFDAVVDTDGDLLGDAWERRYFGSLSNNRQDRRDGSIYSLGQEYFAGTVPTDPTSSPPGPAVALEFSNLRMSAGAAPGELCVCVDWPAAYSRFVEIGFRDSTGLSSFIEVSGLTQEFLAGRFALNINPAAAPRRFFLPFVRLR
jgi:hypothetical protein